MNDTRNASYAALLLRLTLGGLFLAHLGLKFFVFTPAGTAGFFQSIGLPGPLAYVVMLAELIIGVSLILGFHTRFAALAGVPVLLGAIITVHAAAGFFFTDTNGGWEFPAFWIVALLAQALLGDGAYAVSTAAPLRVVAAE
jgi:putative oxidoreductase